MNEFERNTAGSASGQPATQRSSTSSERRTGGDREDRFHDFAGKLRQASVWPRVEEYVQWQRARRAARAAGAPEPPPPDLTPVSINLDLTTACNYACDHCIDWDILNSKVRHDDAELRESVRVMAGGGLRSVILIGGGEPTLYPGFASFVRFLKELGLQVGVVSNGSRNDRVLDAAPALTSGDWVRLSLDAATDTTFRRMHNPSRKSLGLDEIFGWIPKIKAANPQIDIGFSFVITWKGGARGDVKVVENIHEMVPAARRARDAGFDYISFKPFLERAETGSEVMDPGRSSAQDITVRIREGLEAARALQRDGFRVVESINLRVLLAGNWRDYTHQPRTCHLQTLRQVVTPLGLFNCPAHRGVPKARIGERNAYRDAAAARATAEDTAGILDRFDASKECDQVTCIYHRTNWWLEELIEGKQAPDAGKAVPDQSDFFL